MKVVDFVGNDTIKNRFLRVDYDKGENIANKLDLTCRTCGAQLRIYLDGKTRNGNKIRCIYNHGSKSFSANAKIFQGRYFCGNCGRSSAWKNAENMDIDSITNAIMLQSIKNRNYRISAKEKSNTARAKELIKKGNTEYGLENNELQELYDIFQGTENESIKKDILAMLENINYHTEYGQFLSGTFSVENHDNDTIGGYASEREQYYKNMLEKGNRGFLMGLAYYAKYRIARAIRKHMKRG